MKKIFVAIALIAGLGTSSVAFANAKTTNEKQQMKSVFN